MHKLILIASVSRQVSLSSKSPIMRVAIVRDLDSTANSCFKGAPEPRYFAPCLEPYPALCRSICYPLRETPLLLNFPPPLLRRPTSSKRGAAGIERPLKAKHALVPVMMGAAAAQNYTFSTSTFSAARLISLAPTTRGPGSSAFGLLIKTAALAIANAVQLSVCSSVFRVLGMATAIPTRGISRAL